MPKMYVANCTQQNQIFSYRVKGSPSPRQQEIPIGGQIQLSGELSVEDIEYVVQQYGKYGFAAVNEIDRTRPFVGICFSLDKPISRDRIRQLLAHNEGVLVKLGKKIREEAAVALHEQAVMANEGPLRGDIGNEGAGLEVSISEEESRSNPNPKFSEGVRVVSQQDSRKASVGRRGRR